MIDLTMLGTIGSMPMPNRYLSSAILSIEGKKILLDCGEGTQVAMREYHTGFKNIDVICITHLHGDHLFGLPGLLSTIGNCERVQPIVIIGPTGIKQAVLNLCATILPLPYELLILENPEESYVLLDHVKIHTACADHTVDCLSYKVTVDRLPKFDVDKATKNNVPKQLWGRLQREREPIIFEHIAYDYTQVLGAPRAGMSVSFVTDTRPTDALVSFVRGSDLLVCEGTYGDNEDIDKAIKNKHLTFKEAANFAKLAHVKQLVLTHFGSGMSSPQQYLENATQVFKSTMLAYDGYKRTIKFEDKN